MSARDAFEGEAETVRIAMADGKAGDCEVTLIDDLVLRYRHQLERDWGAGLSPYAGEHGGDDRKSARPAIDGHSVRALQNTERRKKARNTEHMI